MTLLEDDWVRSIVKSIFSLGERALTSTQVSARLRETMAKLEDDLRQLISQIGSTNTSFSASSDLMKDLGLNSFRMVEVISSIEERYNVTISEDDYSKLRTLNDFIRLVEQNNKPQAGQLQR